VKELQEEREKLTRQLAECRARVEQVARSEVPSRA